MDPRLTALDGALAPLGLFVRGAFHPTELDRVPRMPDGGITKTAVLLGNAGNDLWEAFSKVPQAPSERDPLEVWLVSHITAIARATLAHPLFVHQGPPYIPIQDWAQRAESIHRSPIGLLIHPEFGLWHAYRAALCFPDALALPPHSAHSSPCEDCAAKPCLHTCPVGAFEGDRFDADACLTHVDSPRRSRMPQRRLPRAAWLPGGGPIPIRKARTGIPYGRSAAFGPRAVVNGRAWHLLTGVHASLGGSVSAHGDASVNRWRAAIVSTDTGRGLRPTAEPNGATGPTGASLMQAGGPGFGVSSSAG